MTLKKTGYTEKTSKNYLINAAAVYTDVTYTEGAGFTGTLHGATSGGVTLTIEQTYRDIEVDGTSHIKVKGNKVLESAFASATVNLKEITAESIRQSLNGAIETSPTTSSPTAVTSPSVSPTASESASTSTDASRPTASDTGSSPVNLWLIGGIVALIAAVLAFLVTRRRDRY